MLHAYSGRRRHGDFQWFFDHIAQEKSLAGFMVLSMDIVIDAVLGDISQADTQRFWLQAIRTGYVVAMLSGPPYCTWSVARGKTDGTMEARGRPGPRVIRTSTDLWGVLSVPSRDASTSRWSSVAWF